MRRMKKVHPFLVFLSLWVQLLSIVFADVKSRQCQAVWHPKLSQMHFGGQYGIYLRELAKDFNVAVTTTDFFSDSDSSVKLHKDYYACKKSKHIVRSINQLREWVMTCVLL
jgi:hypothetical protein